MDDGEWDSSPACSGKGIVILETQQSSGITYRVDYDRVDAEGQKRELHIECAIQVTIMPISMLKMS